MTLLKFVNKFIFQWFCIRLTKCSEKVIENPEPSCFTYSITTDGNTKNTVTYNWYSIQYWIKPCTGWTDDFVYLNKKPKFLRITKKY